MILGNKDFDFTKTRNKTLSFVTTIFTFSIIILILDILLFVQLDQKQKTKLSNILALTADCVNIILVLFQWNALYFFRDSMVRVLIYGTMITYLLVLISTIFQFQNKVTTEIKVQQIIDICCAGVIIIIGIYKSYYSQNYLVKGMDTLNTQGIKSSILSQQQYEAGLSQSLG